MRELIPDIWTWPWFSERHGYNFNGYLVRHAGGNVAVDPVEPTPADLEHLGRAGVATIALTNRNHGRAANRVREHCGARTLIHAADAEYARGQGTIVDGALAPGERLGPFTVVAVPGKSPGEVALLWAERRLLVVGDAVVGKPPGSCALLSDKVMDDPAQLRASVQGLLDLDFDVLLVGDGEPILRDAKARLRALTASWDA